jgi:hypothetical protein
MWFQYSQSKRGNALKRASTEKVDICVYMRGPHVLHAPVHEDEVDKFPRGQSGKIVGLRAGTFVWFPERETQLSQVSEVRKMHHVD